MSRFPLRYDREECVQKRNTWCQTRYLHAPLVPYIHCHVLPQPFTFHQTRRTGTNPSTKGEHFVPSTVLRSNGVIIAFNTNYSSEETPKIWIRNVREKSADIPLVVCGVTGLEESDRPPEREESYRAVCAEAGVEYFGVDLSVKQIRIKRMVETLIEKATARGPVRR